MARDPRYRMQGSGRQEGGRNQGGDVLRVLKPMWGARTETASRLRGRIERVLAWATVNGYRQGDNPARWSGYLCEALPKPSAVAESGRQPALALDDPTTLVERLGATRAGSAALSFWP